MGTVRLDRRHNFTKIHEGTASDLEDVDFTYYLIQFANDTAYQYYKLEVPSAESADVMQISEFILCEKTAGETPAETPVETPAEDTAEQTPPAPATFDGMLTVLSIAVASAVGAVVYKKRSN